MIGIVMAIVMVIAMLVVMVIVTVLVIVIAMVIAKSSPCHASTPVPVPVPAPAPAPTLAGPGDEAMQKRTVQALAQVVTKVGGWRVYSHDFL